MMNKLDQLKREILAHHEVKIIRETLEYWEVINKHGMKDKIARTEVGFVEYMWGK